MPHCCTPGNRLRAALDAEKPLQVAGVINAYAALLAREAGFRAIYLSGAGVAAASHGLPDLGMTTLTEVLEDARRITSAVELPLLVDADTGWGTPFTIARTVREMIRAGVAGIHIEDQVTAKRCGHRPGKEIVSALEMMDRIKSAVDARTDPSFVVMARIDAFSVEGLESAIDRAHLCREAGADMIFPEALAKLDHYRRFVDAIELPVLANLTEFGKTPLFTLQELTDTGVALALYPLSAFRAMSAAALKVYRAIREDGTQSGLVHTMQTREEAYRLLNYHAREEQLDRLFSKEKE
ncbi:MAG: methylisocitrate lyase [Syntrophotaleaceae bacterium]